MTYEAAVEKRSAMDRGKDPAEEEQGWRLLFLVRAARPGYTLTEPSGREPFWHRGVLLAGKPRVPVEDLGDEDRAADDWDVFTYYA